MSRPFRSTSEKYSSGVKAGRIGAVSVGVGVKDRSMSVSIGIASSSVIPRKLCIGDRAFLNYTHNNNQLYLLLNNAKSKYVHDSLAMRLDAQIVILKQTRHCWPHKPCIRIR